MRPATPLLLIQRLDPIYADFTITENDLLSVQRSMKQGTVKTEVCLPDEPQHVRSGDLAFVDNAVQDGTGTVKLRATLPNADHYFWPGRFVKVRLVLRTLKSAVLIPAVAPQESANGPFVYVVGADSTAAIRPVTLGQRHGDLVVIEQGTQSRRARRHAGATGRHARRQGPRGPTGRRREPAGRRTGGRA